MTTAELAKLLNVTPRTIARRVQAGKLTPAYRAPGRTGTILFDLRDLLASDQEQEDQAA